MTVDYLIREALDEADKALLCARCELGEIRSAEHSLICRARHLLAIHSNNPLVFQKPSGETVVDIDGDLY